MFLMQYRRTPLPTGLSPSELLNGRQIRTQIDVILPQRSCPDVQPCQSSTDVCSTPDVPTRSSVHSRRHGRPRRDVLSRRDVQPRRDVRSRRVVQKPNKFQANSPCFAFSFKGGRKDTWKPAVVTGVLGHTLYEVKFIPEGPTCRRHEDQLRPRYITRRHRQ